MLQSLKEGVEAALLHPVSHSPNKDQSEENLVNQLRQLTQDQKKSGLVNAPQTTKQNLNQYNPPFENTNLANSELIQLPIQHSINQQQQPLQLSTPFINAQRSSNTLNLQGVQVIHQLRSTLSGSQSPPFSSSAKGQINNLWMVQPTTSQVKIQNNNQTIFGPPGPPNYIPFPNQRSVQHRPNSTSPQRITFNYQINQQNLSPHIPGNIISPSTKPGISEQPQFILQEKKQKIVWQQRYFTIIERFEYYYQKLQIIRKKCVYLDEAISRTKKAQELQLLHSQSQDLLTAIVNTEQELTETIHRNSELLTEATNWRQKYQQLSQSYQATKKLQVSANQELLKKVNLLDQQLAALEKNYHIIVKKYQQTAELNQRLKQQILRLSQKPQLNVFPNQKQFQLQLTELGKIITQKNMIIDNLRKNFDNKIPNTQSNQQIELNKLNEIISSYKSQIDKIQQQKNSLSQITAETTERYKLAIKTIEKLEEERNSQRLIFKKDIEQYKSLLSSRQDKSKTDSSKINYDFQLSGELQIENKRLKHELAVYGEAHKSDLKILNGQIQQLLDKVKSIGIERDTIITTLQEKNVFLQSDLNRKDCTIRSLRDRILELEEQKRIYELDRKYEPKKQGDHSQQQLKEINELRRVINEQKNQIEELEVQISEYKRISNEYQDTLRAKKHEINSLKHNIEQNSKGEGQLSQLLNKRNEQLAQMKKQLAWLEKMRNQNQLLRQQNGNLNESIKRKHLQLTQVTDKFYILEKKTRELEGLGSSSPKLAQLQEERQLLENALGKKDQEIIKLRQSSQLLQTNISQLELEIQLHKNKLLTAQKIFENQRIDLRNKISNLQLKFIEQERKAAGLEEVRIILSEQINTLTFQLQIKIQNYQRLQADLRQERTRFRAFEQEKNDQVNQIDDLHHKLREWQKKYKVLLRQVQQEAQKKNDLSSTKKKQLIDLNNRILQLENVSKGKESKIKQLQKSNQLLNAKIRGFDHNLEEIEYLKHKISEYQLKTNYQNHRFTISRVPDLEPTQIFQRKVIYQLKIQNQELRKQLGLAPKPAGKEVHIPEHDNNLNVNQRLNDFNKKLEDVISEQVLVDPTTPNNQLYKKYERDRRLLIEKHNQEITLLKVKIHELEEQSKPIGKKYTNINQIFNEQINFYKQKNQELQQRVESHIKMNRELKENIQHLLKSQSGQHSLAYYKEQLQKSSDAIANLQKQLKKTNDELKRIKEDSNKNSPKSNKDSLFQSQARIADLSRKVNQFTLEINLMQKEKLSREEIIQQLEAELKRYRATTQQLKLAKETQQKIWKDKELEFQQQLEKASNKLQFSHNQIQRLNQIITKRQDGQSGQVKALRARIHDLQQENKKIKMTIQELIMKEQKYQRQISKSQNQIQTLIVQMQRLKEIADISEKTHREGDSELQNLRLMISDFEGKIKGLESLRDSFGFKEAQLQQEIARLNTQIRLLTAEIQRLSQFSQKKVAEKDSQIIRLKFILNESQDQISNLQDQIRNIKTLSFKTNETKHEISILQEQISSLKISLGLKQTQSDNRLRQLYETNDRIRYLEDQINQNKRLAEGKQYEQQQVIYNLQNQLTQLRKSRENTQIEGKSRHILLQEQLKNAKQQRDFEISSLTLKISQLESELRQVQFKNSTQLKNARLEGNRIHQDYAKLLVTYNSLNQDYLQIKEHYQIIRTEIERRQIFISELQATISFLESRNISDKDAKYSIEFIRSIFIEIQGLLGEGINESNILFVEQQINLGLQECSRSNQKIN